MAECSTRPNNSHSLIKLTPMSIQNHSQDSQDRYFMMLAIEQAKQGLYTTRPNPAVGCVIVQAAEIVGQGYHPKAGQLLM